jgi:hypothetical protein
VTVAIDVNGVARLRSDDDTTVGEHSVSTSVLLDEDEESTPIRKRRSTGDSRTMDTTESPGYDADDDTAVGENSVRSADHEDEESTPIRKCHPSSSMRVSVVVIVVTTRKSPLSIVHPDIA